MTNTIWGWWQNIIWGWWQIQFEDDDKCEHLRQKLWFSLPCCATLHHPFASRLFLSSNVSLKKMKMNTMVMIFISFDFLGFFLIDFEFELILNWFLGFFLNYKNKRCSSNKEFCVFDPWPGIWKGKTSHLRAKTQESCFVILILSIVHFLHFFMPGPCLINDHNHFLNIDYNVPDEDDLFADKVHTLQAGQCNG